RHVEGVIVVLEDDGNAVQRRSPSFRLPLGVERARLVDRLRIERDDRVQGRSLAIERANAREAHLRQRFGRQRAGVEGGLDVGDRRRIELDRFRAYEPDRQDCQGGRDEGAGWVHADLLYYYFQNGDALS